MGEPRWIAKNTIAAVSHPGDPVLGRDEDHLVVGVRPSSDVVWIEATAQPPIQSS